MRTRRARVGDATVEGAVAGAGEEMAAIWAGAGAREGAGAGGGARASAGNGAGTGTGIGAAPMGLGEGWRGKTCASASDAPQNRQNWEVASEAPRQREQRRCTCGGGGVPRSTTRPGAMAAGGGAGETSGNLGGSGIVLRRFG